MVFVGLHAQASGNLLPPKAYEHVCLIVKQLGFDIH